MQKAAGTFALESLRGQMCALLSTNTQGGTAGAQVEEFILTLPPGAPAVPWGVGFPTVLSSALCPGGRPLEVTGPALDHRGIRFPDDHSTC